MANDVSVLGDNNGYGAAARAFKHAKASISCLVMLVSTSVNLLAQGHSVANSASSAITPILAKCQACHTGPSSAAGLDLSNLQKALKGGKHGPALKLKDPGNSAMYLQVAAGKMPPGAPLTRSEREVFRNWIQLGAQWPESTKSGEVKRAGKDWWSLKPVSLPHVPAVPQQFIGWIKNPIDAYVFDSLSKKGLRPAAPADRQTLIRRVYFDLTGLPPTPEAVKAFESSSDPNAYDKLVDSLLDSPHYGERWARHWLDVARFGESMGYEYDHLRDNAWRYRDYVIKAFNEDKPYARFLTEQIAGDVLPDATPDSVIATGFLVGGPMDEAGKGAPGVLVRQRAREEEMEDIVGLVGQTCLGLTVNCARCHDHKFDPITQKDYYRLKSALIGVNPGDRPVLTPAMQESSNSQTIALRSRLRELRSSLATIDDAVRARLLTSGNHRSLQPGPAPMIRWRFNNDVHDALLGLGGSLSGGAAIAGGKLHLPGPKSLFKSDPIPLQVREKTLEAWVHLSDLAQHGGSALTIETDGGGQFDAVVFGERERAKWISGSDGFQRTKDLAASPEAEANQGFVQICIVYASDNTITLYRNGKRYAEAYTPTGVNGSLRTYQPGSSHILIGQRHTGAQDYLVGDIPMVAIYDHALSPAEVDRAYESADFNISPAQLEAEITPTERTNRQKLGAEIDAIATQLAPIENPTHTYGAISTKPEPTFVLMRGDVQSRGEPVTPGAIDTVNVKNGVKTADFRLTQESSDAERRTRLAAWITDPSNQLTSRVIVNRIWQYHFGTGLVGTPNDFGFNGERPSNPPLLDWLAYQFSLNVGPGGGISQYACGGSLKKLHRLILLSSAYRQAGTFNLAASKIDADDRLLWRYPPQRLEAEEVRDAMLAVSGQLNSQLGGPSFRPFTVESFGSNFYKLVDQDSPEFNRRSIYRMAVQSARSPLLESLDCPDPSTKTPRRTSTTTPTQALELMNDAFVLRQAAHFAARVRALSNPRNDTRDLIGSIYSISYGRKPTVAEEKQATEFLTSHSLESLCWAIFNSSEFLYVQ